MNGNLSQLRGNGTTFDKEGNVEEDVEEEEEEEEEEDKCLSASVMT